MATNAKRNYHDSIIDDDGNDGVIEKDGVPPSFTHPDKLSRLIAKPSGNMARLPCTARGNVEMSFDFMKFDQITELHIFVGVPEPNITWTKGNGPINRSVGKVFMKKWSIVLEDLVPKDSGDYTCKVCNHFGCIEHTYRLIVTGK